MAVRIQLNQGAINDLLRSPLGLVARDMHRRGKNVERAAKSLVPVDKGGLKGSIRTEMVTRNGAPAAKVGSRAFYARWVHEGTGIFGPHKQRIFPKRAKVLRFMPKGSATFIYRYSVAGQKGVKYLKDALLWARD
jgi:hypothetical protein